MQFSFPAANLQQKLHICPARCGSKFEWVPIYGGGGRRYKFSMNYANIFNVFPKSPAISFCILSKEERKSQPA